jgi:hypothetical protein
MDIADRPMPIYPGNIVVHRSQVNFVLSSVRRDALSTTLILSRGKAFVLS